MWHGSLSLRTPGSTLATITLAPANSTRSQSETFYGFRVFDPEARRLLLKEIAGMERSQLKAKLMFWLCVDALVREKIEVPSYTRVTKLILGAINRRQSEPATIIEHTLHQDTRGLLDGLLTQEPIECGTAPG